MKAIHASVTEAAGLVTLVFGANSLSGVFYQSYATVSRGMMRISSLRLMVYLFDKPTIQRAVLKMRLNVFGNLKWVYRAWYYFRMGYATYLTFILGYVSTLVTVYYLAIRNIAPLLDIFPNFAPFAVLATVVGGPLAILVGWVHMKRSRLFSSEQDIAIEANPYQYKLPPGYLKEAWVPVMLMQLRLLRKLSETSGLLTDSERAEIQELDSKVVTLLRGGYLGNPRRGLSF